MRRPHSGTWRGRLPRVHTCFVVARVLLTCVLSEVGFGEHHSYDGLGRLARTVSPFPSVGAEDERIERFTYDGVRRIQEYVTDPPNGNGGGWSPPNRQITREYVWGPGGTSAAQGPGALDELLVQYDTFGVPLWAIVDAGGAGAHERGGWANGGKRASGRGALSRARGVEDLDAGVPVEVDDGGLAGVLAEFEPVDPDAVVAFVGEPRARLLAGCADDDALDGGDEVAGLPGDAVGDADAHARGEEDVVHGGDRRGEASLSRGGASEGVAGAGEVEVAGGEPAGVVGGEGESDLVVADEDVGVVMGRLRRLGDLVDERHGLGEVAELEGALDLPADAGPVGEVLERLADLGVGEGGRVGGHVVLRGGPRGPADYTRVSLSSDRPRARAHTGQLPPERRANPAGALADGGAAPGEREDVPGDVGAGAAPGLADRAADRGPGRAARADPRSRRRDPHAGMAGDGLGRGAGLSVGRPRAVPRGDARAVAERAGIPEPVHPLGARGGRVGAARGGARGAVPGVAQAGADVPWRFATPEGQVRVEDRFAGSVALDPASGVGDFVVWSARGAPAYQLAVVVDDARQGVTQVIRGDDLLDSAARQLLLMRALELAPEPAYTHLPLVVGGDGRRLAKRHGDTRVEEYRRLGVRAERIVGLAAWWSGAAGERRELAAGELAGALNLDTIPRGAVTFTAEDDAWLRTGA
jgi:hypothetical protein